MDEKYRNLAKFTSQKRTMENPIFSRLRSAASFRLEELLNKTCRHTRHSALVYVVWMEHAFVAERGHRGEWWLGHEHRIRQNFIYRVRRPFQKRRSRLFRSYIT